MTNTSYDILPSSDTGEKMGAQWDGTSVITDYESLWLSHNRSTVQLSCSIWYTQETS